MRRPPPTASALIRRLAALDPLSAPAAPWPFADALARWLGWADAIRLRAALDAPPAARRPARGRPAARAEALRLREALRRDLVAATEPAAFGPGELADFAALRRRALSCQQAMAAAIQPLRQRVRDTLAASAAPGGPGLAALDAVLGDLVAAQADALLGGIPARLKPAFDRQLAAPGEAQGAARFLEELRALLLAELELRLLPVEGLLDALGEPGAAAEAADA